MTDPSDPYERLRAPFALRRHQAEALAALEHALGPADVLAGVPGARRRAWVALPPGAGKTLVGLETVRREAAARPGTRAVVLCPNTAIQGQWVRAWRRFTDAEGANPVRAGVDRDLTFPLTVLTYQSLAVFRDDDDADTGIDPDSPLDRLHPNGLELVRRLQEAGPLTIVLDECHHLLEVWGRLLAAVLADLPEATVVGLTATPATSLTRDQHALVRELFGEIAYQASIPAVVREGDLAPFADLVWLTEPTTHETQWLAAQSERFAELTTALLDPAFGSVPFLEWADQRFAGPVPFPRTLHREPELGLAALRLRHVGLLTLPADQVPPAEEREAHRPTADDWARLVGAWHDECLAESEDPRDDAAREALRAILPAVGFRLGRDGVRRGRSTVDRLLARSEAKAQAMVGIVAAEHRALGDRLAMLVVCDHEAATATPSADLRGVLSERAGSARLALALLLADPATAPLDPVLVTGRTVAAAPAVLERLRVQVAQDQPRLGAELVVGEPDPEGIAELTGPWTSRVWVRAVTDLMAAGGTRVLVGTRALLGEGWDAPHLSGLVDLSMAATAATVVQTRGRTLRLDPADPAKVAVNWTIACVAPGHPAGENDWQRVVAKHEGYFGVDVAGEVVDGVAHVHSSFSPVAAPDPAGFDATNAEMLRRAEQRAEIAAAWRVGEPYDDRLRLAVWVRRPGAERPEPAPAGEERVPPTPPRHPMTGTGIGHLDRARTWQGAPSAWLALGLAAAVGTGALAGLGAPLSAAVTLFLAVFATGSGLRRLVARRGEVLDAAAVEPDLVALGCAIADALRARGLAPVGHEGVEWSVTGLDEVRLTLDTGGDQQAADLFARSVTQATAAIAGPRYLVPRYVAPPRTLRQAWRPLARVRPVGVVWHPVPEPLGRRADDAQAYAAAFARWLGGGPAVFTGSAVGTGALAATRGTSPWQATSVLRLTWR